MPAKLSTGMRNHILGGGSVKAALDGGFVQLYGGAEPASPDDPPSVQLLSITTLNSTGEGITLGDPANGVISKNPSEVWSGNNVASGQATHFRWVAAGDTGAASNTELRIQGSCGLVGANLNLSNINLVNGAPQVIDGANITMPVQA